MRPFPRALAAAALLCGLSILSLRSAPAAPDADVLPPHAAGQVIIQFKAGASPAHREDALSRAAAVARERILTRSMQAVGAPGLLVAASRRPVAETVRILRAHPAVAFAEPNWKLEHRATSNDPYYTYGYLWGMYGESTSPANGYGSGAGAAWAAGHTGSSSVYVGVIDEGIDTTQPDLQGNIWTNPYDPVDNTDNDGNGYIDDLHGWDFHHGDNSIYDAGEDQHGTHVAGTIGARGGNGIGVAGVAWDVRLISGKFLGPNGGYIADAVRAVDYFTDLKYRHGLNIVAINNSWGGGGYSQAMHDAIIRAARQNILFVAAAGNGGDDKIGDNNDVAIDYPSGYDTTVGTTTEGAVGYDSVLSVAAIDPAGSLGGFSNYGATTVDLAAPGVGIYSTVPSNTYGTMSGTSMAAPHVTGAAALYAASRPGATALEIRQALLQTALATPSLAGKTVTGGRLNVGGMFETRPVTHDVAVSAVSAPASVTAGESASVSVTVRNEGTEAETVTVSVADSPDGGGTPGGLGSSQTASLPAGGSSTLTFVWDTGNATPGAHTLTATVQAVPGEMDTADNSRSTGSTLLAPRSVLAVAGITPDKVARGTAVTVTVSGAGFSPGATLAFRSGEGGAPQVSNVVVSSDGSTLTATVRIGNGGPKRNRFWDVVVTNPNGQSAVLVDGFCVTP